MANNYNNQVFINCPFDDAYLEMYQACIFVIIDSGFIPRCSREINNGTLSRLDSIVKIISECRYGVHDLSRVVPDEPFGLPRFNMPFEFGIFFSAQRFGDISQKKKNCLILEKEQYRYQSFISDIAGMDITPHANNPRILISGVRQWLHTSSRRTTIPDADEIYDRFEKFQTAIKAICEKKSRAYAEMSFIELINEMTSWLKLNQPA